MTMKSCSSLVSEKPLAGFGAIFDVDGVLVDSYRAHFESWRIMLRRHGLDMTEALFRRTFGRTNRDVFAEEFPSLRREDYAALGEEKEAAYRELLRANFPAMDGAAELVGALHQAGALLAIGSSTSPENIETVLQFFPGREYFAAVTHGREVARGKPDPEVFRKSARKLGIEPRRCVVFEDAAVGVAAGKSAGCKVIALTGTASREELAQADRIVDSLRDVTPRMIQHLLTEPEAAL